MKSFHKQLVPHTAHVNLVDFGLKSAQILSLISLLIEEIMMIK